MKITIIVIAVLLSLFLILQILTAILNTRIETQKYFVVYLDNQFEIRYYPPAIKASITMKEKSYDKMSSMGFRALASYIFGSNARNQKIAMTSPVQIDMNDSESTMSFTMPSKLKEEELPQPTNSNVQITGTNSEYVAVLRFGGFASDASISKHKQQLQTLLQKKGIKHSAVIRFLGYNPPYQIFGRRNEISSVLENFTPPSFN